MNAKQGILFTGLVLVFLCIFIGVASAKTIYVPADYPTIQEAVDNATAGDTVFVYNGTYYENVVVNKPLTLTGENRDMTIIDGNKSGSVVHVSSDNCVVSGFTIRNGSFDRVTNCGGGIWMNWARNNTITNNIILNSGRGISLMAHSFNNTISYNNASFNSDIGIHLDLACNNTITSNGVSNNHKGIYLWFHSCNNTITLNNVLNNSYGFYLVSSCNNNLVYHNNVKNNHRGAYDSGFNFWNNSYSSCGNYWDDYVGSDECSGPNQDQPGSDSIGDTPYTNIAGGAGAIDHYPFMNESGWLKRPAVRSIWYLGQSNESYLALSVEDDLKRLKNVGADWIFVKVDIYQDANTSTTLNRTNLTQTDASLENVINKAHNLGLKVALVPFVIVNDSTWRGYITPSNISAWFDSYQIQMEHYADFADKNGVEMFLVGTELETLRTYDSEWEDIVTAVKSRYSGLLSYNTNWWWQTSDYNIVHNMSLWNHLDYMGISAYFDLTTINDPTVDQLKEAWFNDAHNHNVVSQLESLSAKFGKDILFTEIGYRSVNGTNKKPWEGGIIPDSDNTVDEQEQADCFNAVFQVFKPKTWLKGMAIWEEKVGLPFTDKGYDFLNRKAESIIHQNWVNAFNIGEGTYPSIMGVHKGAITPNHDVEVTKMYTYPCAGTGGYSEYVWIYGNGINESASWTGYQVARDYHYREFDGPFTLEANVTYNYTIKTGSYPQIHYNRTLIVPDGEITCIEFIDANGKKNEPKQQGCPAFQSGVAWMGLNIGDVHVEQKTMV